MLKCFKGLIFLLIIPILTRANDGKPVLHYTMIISFSAPSLQFDTTRKVKTPEIANNKPVDDVIKDDIIKVVPKARKQAIPIPVKLKPVKIIKPKIIRPVIKILN